MNSKKKFISLVFQSRSSHCGTPEISKMNEYPQKKKMLGWGEWLFEVQNVEYPQDCPPQDWPHGGQS